MKHQHKLEGYTYKDVETFNSMPSVEELERLSVGLKKLQTAGQTDVYSYILYQQTIIALKVILCIVSPATHTDIRATVTDILRAHQPVGELTILNEEQASFLVHSMLKDEQGINLDDDVPLTDALINMIKEYVRYAKNVLTGSDYSLIRSRIVDEMVEQENKDTLKDAIDSVAPVDLSKTTSTFTYTYPILNVTEPPSSPASASAPAPVAVPAPASVSVPAPASAPASAPAPAQLVRDLPQGLTGAARVLVVSSLVVLSLIIIILLIFVFIKLNARTRKTKF